MMYHGDLFDVLPTLPDNSVDACVTDPPYELGFMSKAWDRTGVAYNQETWRTIARVLKPGAHLLAFGGTRTFHRITCAIEDAGFEVRDCLSWLYGSGFPKSLNLGDGRGTALKPAWEPIVLARKPLTGSVAANVEKHGTGALNIDACRVDVNGERWDREPGTIQASESIGTFKTGARSMVQHDLGRWPANVVIDDLAALVIDEQSGELRTGSEGLATAYCGYQGGWGPRKVEPYDDVGGASRFYKVCPPDCILCDMPTDEQATMRECANTSASCAERRFRTIRQTIDAIAPQHARVTLVEQLARRVPSAENLCARCGTRIALALVEIKLSGSKSAASQVFQDSTPNFKSSILTRNLASFAELWESIDTIPTTASLSLLCGSVARAIENSTRPGSLAGDSDQPRFLYSAKPSREERDMGCYDLPPRLAPETVGRDPDSAGARNPRAGAGRGAGTPLLRCTKCGCDGGGGRYVSACDDGDAHEFIEVARGEAVRNFHPTVKPIELMRWLVRLVTPPNGTVLDPFMGSGTTGIACVLEQREFIGVEQEQDYVEIAKRRIAEAAPLFATETVTRIPKSDVESAPSQTSLFTE